MSVKVKYPVVLIKWDDAESDATWSEEPTNPLTPTIATTLGFLIVDQADYVLVADSYFDKGKTISNTTKIPRGMIKEFIKLSITKQREKSSANASKPRKLSTPEVLVEVNS